MVGNTPVDVRRPAEGSQEVSLRLRGHTDASIEIGDSTDDTVQVTMRRERRAQRRIPVIHHRPAPVAIAPPRPPPPPRPRRSTSEVVDPWNP